MSLEEIDRETAREFCTKLADSLASAQFRLDLPPEQTPQDYQLYLYAWAQGFNRAIHEIRAYVDYPDEVPDDLSGLAQFGWDIPGEAS
jgi:hypothetical protein